MLNLGENLAEKKDKVNEVSKEKIYAVYIKSKFYIFSSDFFNLWNNFSRRRVNSASFDIFPKKTSQRVTSL